MLVNLSPLRFNLKAVHQNLHEDWGKRKIRTKFVRHRLLDERGGEALSWPIAAL
jgi:hypothetical protein